MTIYYNKKDYNYFDYSNTTNLIIPINSIPILIYANPSFQLSIDTSNGSRYSDYTFNGFDSYYNTMNWKRINLDLNWRYYFRIYYEKETNSTIQFSKNYSTINKEELKITAWLNLTNGTSLNTSCLIKTQICKFKF